MSRKKDTVSRHFAIVTPPCKASMRSATSSRHFVDAPSSPIGSVYSLPNFLETLIPPNVIIEPGDGCSCQRLAQAARAQFAHCPFFVDKQRGGIRQANAIPSNNEESMSCCDRKTLAFQNSVCHLCPHGCFLRAFAPLREWHSLRAAIAEQSSVSPDTLLKGWRCSLVGSPSDDQDDSRKRKRTVGQVPLVQTVFISPDRKCFKGRQRVMREIGLGSSSVEDNDDQFTMLPRRKRVLSTNLQQEHSATLSTLLFFKSKVSPFGLLEELFRTNPWRLLVSTIMLNRTTRCQVDVVLYAFLQKWPDASSATGADEMELAQVILPLGLRFRRAKGIIRFSQEWLQLLERKTSESCSNKDPAFSLTREDVLGLYNCGDYAYDAYRIFIQGIFYEGITSADVALQIYLDYRRGLDKAMKQS